MSNEFVFPIQDIGKCQVLGMTLRDYFAAKALMGLMASRDPRTPRFIPDDDAMYVYAVADAMLKARGKS